MSLFLLQTDLGKLRKSPPLHLLLVFIKLTKNAVDVARRIISFSVLRLDVVDFSIEVRSNTFSSFINNVFWKMVAREVKT